ncbi:hypothetical protein QYF36_021078 [Acer negundo]|nr:hypothetical protein QYF36_021078 [Acer negundo]
MLESSIHLHYPSHEPSTTMVLTSKDIVSLGVVFDSTSNNEITNLSKMKIYILLQTSMVQESCSSLQADGLPLHDFPFALLEAH